MPPATNRTNVLLLFRSYPNNSGYEQKFIEVRSKNKKWQQDTQWSDSQLSETSRILSCCDTGALTDRCVGSWLLQAKKLAWLFRPARFRKKWRSASIGLKKSPLATDRNTCAVPFTGLRH